MLMLSEALIGAGAGVEFMAFARDADLPDPEMLLADPDSFALPARIDQQYACLEAVRAAVAADTTAARWEAAFKVCISAGQQGAPDTAGAVVRGLAAIRPAKASLDLPGFEVFTDLLMGAIIDNDGDGETGGS